jgi:phosphatidylserine/phosphatidylglycerophosphate/cardiolipin synthase-like enzyme
MHGDARYYLIHAKLIVLDRQRLLVSTQNMSGDS